MFDLVIRGQIVSDETRLGMIGINKGIIEEINMKNI